jgi:hypothetical protein
VRKLVSSLFISLDGVVESPNEFVGPGMYEDFPKELDEALAEQDAVLLEHGGPPIHLELQSSRATRTGMQYLVYTPRR